MKRITTPTLLLILFVVINLIIALFIVGDFGRSTDEYPEFRRADVAVQVYFGDLVVGLEPAYENLGHERFYGTAITGLIRTVERVFFPNTNHDAKVVAHYCYFVFFQLSLVGLYLLGNQFYDQWISLGVAAIFGTQPLLFGHGFINPKDIPLMAVFLLATATGFRMVDKWIKLEPASVSSDASNVSRMIIFGVTMILFTLVVWSNGQVTNLVLDLVEFAYRTKGTSFAGKIFSSLTTSGSLEGYLVLAQNQLARFYRWMVFLSPVILALIFRYANKHNLFRGMITWDLFLASFIWGVALSTRMIAFAAGGLVGLYALIKLRQRVIAPLITYVLSASVFSYLSWPYLWVTGVRGYLYSLENLGNFPWFGTVLFEGQEFDPHHLPARYMPKLMTLQFTETAVILILIGMLISLLFLVRKQVDAVRLSLLFAWFFLPVFYILFMKPVIYNNFRHFLFILPPLFVFAGLALEQIANWLKKPIYVALVFVVVLLPGIISMVKYHPYQYIYYNSFIGGINGAYQNYELDYWGLSYKEAMGYINENAAAGSEIFVWKNNRQGADYAAKEFTITAHNELTEAEIQMYDYGIIPFDRIDQFDFLEDFKLIYIVSIDGVDLAAVIH